MISALFYSIGGSRVSNRLSRTRPTTCNTDLWFYRRFAHTSGRIILFILKLTSKTCPHLEFIFQCPKVNLYYVYLYIYIIKLLGSKLPTLYILSLHKIHYIYSFTHKHIKNISHTHTPKSISGNRQNPSPLHTLPPPLLY